MTGIKQFGNGNKLLHFQINGEDFYAAPEISSEVMLDMAELKGKLGEESDIKTKINAFAEVFQEVLTEDSYNRLLAGMKSKKRPGDETSTEPDPIGIGTVSEIMEWLFGDVYGKRPTLPQQS